MSDMARHAGAAVAAQSTIQVFTLLFFVLAARQIPPSQFGVFVGLYSISVVVGDLLDFGLSKRILRDGRTLEGSVALRRQVMSRGFMLVPVAGIAATLPWLLQDDIWQVQFAGVAVGRSVIQPVQMWFQSNRRVLQAMTIVGCERATSVLLLGGLVVVTDGLDARQISTLMLFSTVVASTVAVASLPALPSRHVPVLWGRSFALASLSADLAFLDVAIVAVAASSVEAAMFSIGARMVTPLMVPVYAVGIAMLATKAVERRDTLAVAGLIAAVSCVLVGLAASAEVWTVALFGSEFTGAARPAAIYCLAAIAAAIGTPVVVFLQRAGRQVVASVTLAIGAGTTLLLIGVGAGIDGATGAAFGYLVAQFGTLFALFWSSSLLRRVWAARPPRERSWR